MNKLLQLRNEKKTKKPRFERAQATMKSPLKGSWRKPKGMHNKTRLSKRGKGALPTVGYGSPKDVKGLERNGMETILVHSLKDLDRIQEHQGILLSSKLGLRKKVVVVKTALEKKLSLFNLKHPEDFLHQIEEALKKKKEEAKKKQEAKKKAQEKLSKKEKDSKEKEDVTQKVEKAEGEKSSEKKEPTQKVEKPKESNQ